MTRQDAINYYISKGATPDEAAAKADAKMKADPSRFSDAPKPAAKPPPKSEAEAKAETKPADGLPPDVARMRARAAEAASEPPSLPMRTPQPQSVYGGAYPSEGEAMSPDRYQRFVAEAKGAPLTQGIQYLAGRAATAVSRPSAGPAVKTSDIMTDDAKRVMSPRAAMAGDIPPPPKPAPPPASVRAALSPVQAGDERRRSEERATEVRRRKLLDAARGDDVLAGEIARASADDVNKAYAEAFGG